MAAANADRRKETVDKIFEAWNTGDIDTLDLVFTQDFVYHFPPMPDLDLSATKQFIAGTRVAQPDFKCWRVGELITEGDRSSYRGACSGTSTGINPMVPIPATGKHQSTDGTMTARWQDDKIAEIWHHHDWLGMLQQFGVVPPLG